LDGLFDKQIQERERSKIEKVLEAQQETMRVHSMVNGYFPRAFLGRLPKPEGKAWYDTVPTGDLAVLALEAQRIAKKVQEAERLAHGVMPGSGEDEGGVVVWEIKTVQPPAHPREEMEDRYSPESDDPYDVPPADDPVMRTN